MAISYELRTTHLRGKETFKEIFGRRGLLGFGSILLFQTLLFDCHPEN